MNELTSAAHIAATASFIAANPSDATLTRTTMLSDSAGGRVSGAEATSAVTGRLVGHRSSAGDQARANQDGDQVAPTHTYVMPAGTDAKVGDALTIDGVDYIVTFVSDSPPWRINAEVVER